MDSAPAAAIATEGSETVPINIDININNNCKMGEVDKDKDTVDHALPLLDSMVEACMMDMLALLSWLMFWLLICPSA